MNDSTNVDANASRPLDPATLPDDPAALRRIIGELVAALQAARQEIAGLRQRHEALVRRLYGPRAERVDPNQPLLFVELATAVAAGDAVAAAVAEAPVVVEPDPAFAARPKKPHGRRRLEELLPKLPVERREHELSEAERLCPCCGGLRHKIGEQTTQQLEYVPARLVRIEHAQFTYSCPYCPEHIVTAAKPPQPIDRGLPGPGLLAGIITHKYDEHSTLYRLELTLWRYGVFLARSTTCAWMAACAELLRPLVARMKEDLFESRVIQTDSTAVSVLMEGQQKAATGHLWDYLGDAAHPQVVIDFSLDHCKEHPHDFLAEYTGYVQADACSGYDGLFVADATHPKIEVGCWSHARRYFEEARDSDPEYSCVALGLIGELFAIEARAQRDQLTEAEVRALRQREAVPILAALGQWLEGVRERVLPKSPIASAITYTTNQWQALQRYTEAGFLTIDNNASERINKIIAISRRNWLFVGSPQGGETAAVLFSITATCRRLGMDAFAYLRDVLARLPTQRPEQLDELLPNRWLASHPEARYPPERERETQRQREAKRQR
jgi:transposase